jgi:putative membrane protein
LLSPDGDGSHGGDICPAFQVFRSSDSTIEDVPMLTDALLAIAHHLLVFGFLGILITEMVSIRPTMTAKHILYVARLDIAYGIVALLIIIVGFGRVYFGIKGPAFYELNPIFWAKIGAFVIVGLLSIPPTMQVIRWRRAVSADAAFVPALPEIKTVRRFMHYEGMVFFTIPVFAALMARGYGL